MANTTQRVRILNVLPDEEFHSRPAEIQKLFNAGLDVARALQPSCFLSGNRKSGKTEVLKRLYIRLFSEQDRVVPFFHPFPKSPSSAEVFCREYFFRAIRQFVAFLKKDPVLVMTEDFNLDPIIQLAYESKFSWLIEAVDNFHSHVSSKDLQAISKLAIHFASIASLRTGLGALVILDDFHHLASLPSESDWALLAGNFMQAMQSREAPHLFSGTSKATLQRLFKTAELPGNVEVITLSPFSSSEAQTLLEKLCQRFDVALEKELSLYIVQRLDNNAFYIRALVQAARRDLQDFRTIRNFVQVYTRELTQGNLHLYFNSLIHSASLTPLERIKAIELLQLCTRTALDFSTFHYYRSRKNSEGFDFERVLNVLDELALIDYGLGVVSSIQDSLLKDWIDWNFAHKISGLSMQQVSYSIASGLLKKFSRSLYLTRYAEKMERVRQVLSKMDCQLVSALLFDYKEFIAYQEIPDPERRSVHLSEQPEVSLPEIISVVTHEVAASESVDFTESIFIGRGFEGGRYRDETEVDWVVGCIFDTEAIGLQEIQRFHQECQRIIQENNLKNPRPWLVAEGRFNQAALSFAQEHRIQTSGTAQLDMLFKIIVARALPLEEESPPKDLVAYDMSIPMISDAELVAVRALEQIAENINFNEKSKGQIRMALIEACVNAKEVSPTGTGKIHLTFQTASDRLISRLFIESPPTKREQVPRAWSLKMLQNLMDEVKLSHTHHGLELVMTKYLRNAKGEAV